MEISKQNAHAIRVRSENVKDTVESIPVTSINDTVEPVSTQQGNAGYNKNFKEVQILGVQKKIIILKAKKGQSDAIRRDVNRTRWLTEGESHVMSPGKLEDLEKVLLNAPYIQELTIMGKLAMHMNVFLSQKSDFEKLFTKFLFSNRTPDLNLTWIKEQRDRSVMLYHVEVIAPTGFLGNHALIITSKCYVKGEVSAILDENLYCINEWKRPLYHFYKNTPFGKLFRSPGMLLNRIFSFDTWKELLKSQQHENMKEKSKALFALLKEDPAAKCAMPLLKELLSSIKPIEKGDLERMADKYGWRTGQAIFSDSGFVAPAWLNEGDSNLLPEKLKDATVLRRKALLTKKVVKVVEPNNNPKLLVANNCVYVGGNGGIFKISNFNKMEQIYRGINNFAAMVPIDFRKYFAVIVKNGKLYFLSRGSKKYELLRLDQSVIIGVKDVQCTKNSIFFIRDKEIQKWNFGNGELLTFYKKQCFNQQISCFCVSKGIASSEEVVIVAFKNNELVKLSTKLEKIKKAFFSGGKINCLLAMPTQSKIVIGQEKRIKITDNNFRQKHGFKHDETITCLARLNESSFVYGDAAGKICVFDLLLGKIIIKYRTNCGTITSIIPSKYGRDIIVTGSAGNVAFYKYWLPARLQFYSQKRTIRNSNLQTIKTKLKVREVSEYSSVKEAECLQAQGRYYYVDGKDGKEQLKYFSYDSEKVLWVQIIDFDFFTILFVADKKGNLFGKKVEGNRLLKTFNFEGKVNDRINCIARLDNDCVMLGLDNGQISIWKLKHLPTMAASLERSLHLQGQKKINSTVAVQKSDNTHIYVVREGEPQIWVLSPSGYYVKTLNPRSGKKLEISCLGVFRGHLLIGYSDGVLIIHDEKKVVIRHEVYNAQIDKIIPKSNDKFYAFIKSESKLFEFSVADWD